MLVECGFVRATTDDGQEYTFRPSLGRIAGLGSPHELVGMYAALHGPRAEQVSVDVLAGLCDQDDPTPLIGWHDADGWHDGLMPPAERVIIARHLLQHGMVGKARPDKRDPRQAGEYREAFDAAEFIAAARAHLGVSAADAEALSMTEFQSLMEAKFQQKKPGREVPSRAAYERGMAALREARERAAANGSAAKTTGAA